MHKPYIGEVLPVYVWDQYEEFDNVIPMIDLDNQIIETYLNNNIKVLKHIVQEYNVTVLHANHAVLNRLIGQKIVFFYLLDD